MKRIRVLIVLLAISVFLAPAQAQRHDIDAMIAGMTLEQKVGQMFLVGLYSPVITEEGRRFLTEYQPGGVVVFEYNAGSPEAVTALINDWQTAITAAGAPPLLIGVDQEGGRINTLEEPPFTQFPVPALVTAASNHNLAYRVGVAQSLELRAVGIHMNLAPVADLETNPDNPVIFRRAYGSDPYVVAPVISATVQGMQDAGVIATLKHFPGHGDTSEDSHITLPVLPYNLDALEQLELIPFRAGVQAGAEAVMVGHLWLPEIDPTPNRPASLSPIIVTDLLRDELGFEGIIMTDALDMDAIDTNYSTPQSMVMAVQAGVDVLTTGPHMGMRTREASIKAIVAAVRTGDIAEAQIDASVRRILSAKERYGVLDWQPLPPESAEQRVRNANGGALVNELFVSGVTLVYDSAALLPFAQLPDVLLAYPYHRLSVKRACETANPNLQLVGFSNFPSAEEVEAVVYAADNADSVIVFTQNAVNKPEQAALVNALPPEKTVVVAYWSPYDLNVFYRRPAAYLTTYSPHDEGIIAACDVLFGQAQAQGRLPINLTDDLLAASGAGLPVR